MATYPTEEGMYPTEDGMYPTEDAAPAQTRDVEIDQDLMQLNVGDFVGILTHHMGDGKVHWTLGTVESPPYLQDVEIRLWEKQRTEYYNEDDVPATEETEALMNRIAQVKSELQTSIEQADDLTAQLRERRASIMQQMEEADEYVAESKAVMHAARDDVANIPDRHWRELKSYRIPPKMVLVVLRAVMLLLSEDEARTWQQMQRILRDFNFKTRITSYDPEQQLSPERREYILQECVSKKSFRYDRAMQGSVAIGPIYYWVLAQLDVGEAQSQKSRVNQEMVARQKELRQVLKDINDQQQRITEYQELMDDLDDQLRLCHQAANQSPSRSAASASRSRMRGTEAGRYYDSFAYAEGKEYLKPAFYGWKPTDRVIIVLRRNVVCNFDGVTSQEREEGYNLSEPQVRVLDDALLRRQAELERLGEEENVDMFQKDAAAADARSDRDIMANRERAAAEGKPTPLASPSGAADDSARGLRGAEAKDSLQRRFEGKSWQRVLDRKRMAIMNTFTEESAEVLDVPEYYVSVTDLTVGSLVVDFDVQHDGSRSKEELQGRVNACGYPKLMALYEEEEDALAAEDGQSPEHQMKFGGERWADIIPREREQVSEAFIKDTQAATDVPAEDIKVMDVRVEEDGLTVDYSIANREVTAEEVQDLVDRFDYPEVWSLYQRLSELPEGNGAVHQVRFRGERWASLLEENGDEIREAFVADTAKALEVQPEQVQAETMHYDRGLIVPYTISDAAMSDDDMDQRVEDFKYPQTWALYDRLLAQAAGASYQRAFEGAYWEAVLNEARPELAEAFRNDSARALDVPVQQVEACSLDTDNDRLLVSFNIVTDTKEPVTIRETTQQYEYPKVWSLYGQVVEEQEAATSNMNRHFDGELWEQIADDKKEAIEEAFTRDATAALDAKAQQVKVLGVSANKSGMDVNFSAEGEGLLEYDVRQALEDEKAFPSVWNLYTEAGGDADKAREADLLGLKGGRRAETAVLERVFEGDDWDILLDGCPEDVSGAFQRDAANALGTSPRNIRVVSAKLGSLIMNYQVIDPDMDDDDQVAQAINDHDFPELTGMYRRRLRGGADGDDGASKAKENAGDEDLNADEWEELGDASRGEKEFVGDLWEDVHAAKKADLERAFKEDTADALELASPEDVEVTGVKPSKENIVYTYKINNSEKPANEVKEALEEYPYPAMWELYALGAEDAEDAEEPQDQQSRAAPVAAAAAAAAAEDEDDMIVTSHQVGFDGDDWQYVLDNHRAELEEAFEACTAELFSLNREHVMNTVYSIGSLLVDFELKHPSALSEEEVNQKLNECAYEPVWDLYGQHPYDPSEVTRTEHEVGFEGAGWAGVLRESEAELREGFVADTADALDVQQEECEIVSMTYEEESLLVKVIVVHSVLQDQDLIQEQLSSHPYDRVWDMYEEGPDAGTIDTTHQVGFGGEDWKYVVEKKPDELREAFVTSTAALFGVEEHNVENPKFTIEDNAMLVDFDLKHPETMSEEEVNEKLATCEYEAVWDLYGEHPFDPTDVNVTTHEVGFEGEEWDKVLEFESDKLREALVLDTADAVGVTSEDVQVKDMKFIDNALVADLDVKHPTLQDQDLIQEQLSGYPYERVWAVYEEGPVSEAAMAAAAAEAAEAEAAERAAEEAAAAEAAQEAREAREADLLGLKGGRRGETAVLERVFEGDDWDILLDGCPEDVNGAFQRDAANALGTSPSKIRVVSAEIGSLIVRYVVVDPEMDDDDQVAEAVNGDEFPELTGMYRRRLRAGADGEDGEGNANEQQAENDEEDLNDPEWEELGDERDEAAEEAAEEAAAAAEEEAAPAEEAAERAAPLAAAAAGEEEDIDSEEWVELHDEHAEGRFKKEFPGDNWENCVNENKDGVSEAMRKDVSDCLGVAPEDVDVRTIKTNDDGVRITYDARELPAGMTGEEAQSKSDAYDYPALWAMYHEADGKVTTAHAVRFEADGWDYIVRRRRWELARALSDDAAEAISIDPESAVDMQMVVSPEALDVTVQLVHEQSLTIEEIDEKLTASPFTRVWALYENLAPSAEMTKTFQGSAWGPVVESNRDGVENAFATDAAKATNVSRLEVEVQDVKADDEKMSVSYVVRGSNLADNEVEQRAEQYPFPAVWALYEGEDGLQHPGASAQKTFAGPAWGEVLNEKRAAVEEAFKQDTAAATSTSKDQVGVTSVYSNEEGLVVNYKVNPEEGRESELPAEEELVARVNEYDYPAVWNLYEESNRMRGMEEDERESGELRRVFDGDDWDLVLDGCPEEANDAFKKGVADSLDVPARKVKILNSQLGSLIMDYKVRGYAGDDEEINAKVADAEFPELWALYQARMRGGAEGEGDAARALGEERAVPALPEGWAQTTHQAGFDGEDWAYVVKTCPNDLVEAFAKDTASCLGLEHAEHVCNVQPGIDDQLVVDFEVQHPEDMTAAQVDEKLRSCGYESVWALYGTHPYEASEKVTTTHSIGFEGEDWDYVLGKKHDEVIKAFKVGTGNALIVPESDVVDVEVEKAEDGVVLTCKVNHSPLQDEEVIQEELQQYAYEEMWALYEVRPYDEENMVSTLHQIEFEGDAWYVVCELQNEELRRALILDTAAAMDVEEKDVSVVETKPDTERMIVRLRVSHSPLLDTELIEEMVQKYGYENVWALYDTTVESEVMTKDFAGERWSDIVAANEREIDLAFVNDSGNMLNLPPRFIKVKEVTSDDYGMTVAFTTFGDWFEAEEVRRRADSYPFPQVWELYNTDVAAAAEPEEAMASRAIEPVPAAADEAPEMYRKAFPGNNWERVMEAHHDEVVEAFKKDTFADAPVDEESFDILTGNATEISGLVFNFNARGVDGAEREQVQQAVDASEYPSVWALYEARPTGTVETKHSVTFEGEAWEWIMARKAAPVHLALQEDTAEALKVNVEDVTDVQTSTEPAGLVAVVTVRHPAEQDEEVITEEMNQFEFPRTWVYYCPPEEAPAGAKHFSGDWRSTIDEREEAIKTAFAKDVSEAINTPAEDIEVERVEADDEGMGVAYKVHFTEDLEEDLESALENYPFPNVWALYSPDTDKQGVTEFSGPSHNKTFDGDNWDAVLTNNRAPLEEAFKKDTADALETTPEKVDITSIYTTPDAMVVNYKTAEDAGDDQTVDDKAANAEYPAVWALYEDERESGELRRVFDGDDWDLVLDGCPEEANDAFKKGVADSLGVPARKVKILNSQLGSLIMDYKVRGYAGDDEEINAKVADAEFPELWALYQARMRGGAEGEGDAARALGEEEENINDPEWEELGDERDQAAEEVAERAAPLAAAAPEQKPYTQHEAEFDGKDWDYVLANKGDAVRDAIREDTAAATGRSVEEIEDVSTTLKGPAMEAQVKITRREDSDEAALDQAVRDYDYPRTWALYEEGAQDKADEGLAKTKHTSVFEGEDWTYVVKDNVPQVTEAFKQDTAEAVGGEARHVQDLRITTGESGATMTFTLAHPAELSADAADEQMEQAPYNRVWSLYGPRPYDPNDVVATSHDVGFEGEDWDYVYSTKKEAVHEAFATGVAAALQVEPTDVEKITMEKADDGIVLSANVTHPTLQDEEMIQDELRAHQFPELWALYEPRPYDPSNTIETKHSVTFEGEAWEWIMGRKAREVHLAIQNDTAESLTVDRDFVRDVQTTVEPAGLVAIITVRHSPLQDEEVITEEMNRYEFPRTWAFYCPPEEAPTGAKHFDGNWDAVVADKTDAVKAAFAKDTARAVSVAEDDVEVEDIEATPEGMNVAYKVHFTQATAEEVGAQSENYPYPNVWALYQPDTDRQGVTEFSSTPHRKMFFGNNWDTVVKNNRAPLEEAFKKDTAEAMQVQPEDVQVTSVYTTPEGMVANYRVANSQVADDNIDDVAAKYEYPAVWALYEDERESGELRRVFDGEDWDLVLEGCPEEANDAFKKGVADSLDVPTRKVKILNSQLGSLIMDYKVRGYAGDDEEINAKVADAEFPELWALYQARMRGGAEGEGDAARALGEEEENINDPEWEELGDERDQAAEETAERALPAAAVRDRYTDLSVSFEGDDWDYVVEKKAPALTEAFKGATATALSLEKEDVAVTEFVLGNFLIQFRVHHPSTMTESEMREKIDSYPYEEVWALYEARPSETVATHHDVGFEADGWEDVVMVREEEIKQAFVEATAKACEVEPSAVRNPQITTYPTMMKVSCSVAHKPDVSENAVNTQINRYPYEEVWALYEEIPLGDESGVMTKTFEGDDWDQTLEMDRPALEQAFVSDTMQCLRVPRGAVSVKSMNIGSLQVDYTVRTQDMNDADIAARVDSYPYPEVWALYRPRQKTREGALSQQRQFKGRAWDAVASQKRAELHQAFMEDTAEVLETPKDNVEVTSMYTTEGALVVNYKADKDGVEQDEVHRAIHDGDYPRVWDLYKQFSDEGFEHTPHSSAFDGEDWDYVLERNRRAVEENFTMCTAQALGLQSRHVTKLEMSATKEAGLRATYDINHPKEMTENTINDTLRAAGYEPLWDLYETRPYDPSVVVVTSHEVAFEGESWDYTLSQKRELVEKTFLEETAAALQVEESALRGLRTETSPSSMVMGINVEHSPLQDDELVQTALRDYPYTKLWDLYETRPYDPKLDNVASTHQVGFEGDRWGEVMAARRARVVDAVRADAAETLQVPAESVTEVTTDVSKTMMVAVITVEHPKDISTNEVQRTLSEFDYPRTWALYDEVTNPHVDVLKSRDAPAAAPAAPRGGMSQLMTKRFDGVDWDLAMNEYPEAIHDAFVVDTSDVLQCPAADIEVDGMALGSLIVQYRVSDLQMPERKATNLTDNYAYPNVWALYKSRTDAEAGLTSARPSYRNAPSQPALSQVSTARRTVREPEPDTEADQQEEDAKKAAEDAQKAADEAERREEEAKKAAEEAEKRRQEEEEAAAREEEEARKAMERAKQRREAAQKAADDAREEEERRAREALEEKQRALDAAQRAEEAAEEAQRRRVKPLSHEDAQEEEDSITYLRKALAQARQERDDYQDMVDRMQEKEQQQAPAAASRSAPAPAAAPASEPNYDSEDEL